MKKGLKVFLILAALVAVFVFLRARQTQAEGNKFNGVMPFTTFSGLLGFFDQNDGKVYIYDGNFKNCLRVLQVGKLGEQINPAQALPAAEGY